MSKKPGLSGVTETMLQTIYARAKETKTRGAIKDSKAVEIIDSLDYDFSLADKDSAMHNGVIARTIVLDRLAGKFLRSHPGAVAVNIACGLDTRCYRMKGYSHWYNLDIPETIEVRRSILPPTEKITQIAMSAMDDWGGEVAENGVPALVIIEGDFSAVRESAGAGGGHEPRGSKAIQGKIHRGEQGEIHLGREERRGSGGAGSGFHPRGRPQPDRGNGGVHSGV